MSERAYLLSLLIDEEVVSLLKSELTATQRAALVREIVNPHKPLTTAEKAELAGVSERTVRDRNARQ